MRTLFTCTIVKCMLLPSALWSNCYSAHRMSALYSQPLEAFCIAQLREDNEVPVLPVFPALCLLNPMHSERCLSYVDLHSGPSKPRAMCLLEKFIRQCTTKYHNVKKIHCAVINTGMILKILVRAGHPPIYVTESSMPRSSLTWLYCCLLLRYWRWWLPHDILNVSHHLHDFAILVLFPSQRQGSQFWSTVRSAVALLQCSGTYFPHL